MCVCVLEDVDGVQFLAVEILRDIPPAQHTPLEVVLESETHTHTSGYTRFKSGVNGSRSYTLCVCLWRESDWLNSGMYLWVPHGLEW